MSDDPVQRTNDDATICKRSAVSLGYWEDQYLNSFTTLDMTREPRKSPEIHMGYYTRVQSIWSLLLRTIDQICSIKSDEAKLQVLNLGAGYDTLYWRLADYLSAQGNSSVLNSFIDIDFPEVTARKCMIVRKSKKLLAKVAEESNEEVKFSRTDLHGPSYHVLGVNFTDLDALEKKLSECSGFDYGIPTIFLSECVLVYIEPSRTTAFFKWAAAKFASTSLALINHEQLNMRDKFGQVMLENLSQRGCGLPGIEACTDKNSQLQRLTNCGWHNGQCWSMAELYDTLLPRDEIQRIEKIEFLDERELAAQLFGHYCITYGWKNGPEISFDDMELW